jgi:phosphoenolpyruvate-protein phosphotransferase (PTS system enzyme I)
VNLPGIGVSPGVAVGPALVLEREAVALFRLRVPPEGVGSEVERLQRAVEASRAQLQAVRARLAREVGGAPVYIFEAHLLMLDDPLLVPRALAAVREEHVNAEWALRRVSDQLHEMFEELPDPYLRERTTDLDDVLGRILLNLNGTADAPSLAHLPGPVVLVATDLSPSEAAELDWKQVLAVATDAGSATHHAAILARSFGIPAVVGLQNATRRVPPGALVVVDGSRGEVVVEPSGDALVLFRAEEERNRVASVRARDTRLPPSVTLDGVPVLLQANAEFLGDADSAREYGASGIGLFRSEYLLGRGRRWPDEEQQVATYRRLLEAVHPHPVTVRTWDVGAEDLAPGGPSSLNPALGERALRLSRRVAAPFLVQVRALLRAAVHGPLRILFPFVGGPADLDQAEVLLAEAREGLRRDGLPFAPDTPIGLTIEVPSAAATADLLAPRVAFFSVGTNDLIQYLLAVDRSDPRVSPLYEPLHPAVLRTIVGVVRAAREAGIPLSLCGEMAADPVQALVLLGLGVRELSMRPPAIPQVNGALRAVREEDARRAAVQALALPTAGEIEAMLRRELGPALAPLNV